jgi:hypothetical protein
MNRRGGLHDGVVFVIVEAKRHGRCSGRAAKKAVPKQDGFSKQRLSAAPTIVLDSTRAQGLVDVFPPLAGSVAAAIREILLRRLYVSRNRET